MVGINLWGNTSSGVFVCQAWSPLSLPGLLGWYLANSTNVSVSGADVTAWADTSGLGNNLRMNATTPQYEATGFNGKPTVHFSKPGYGFSYAYTQQGAMNVGANSPNFSVFVVGQYILAPTNQRIAEILDTTASAIDYANIKSACLLIADGTSGANMCSYMNNSGYIDNVPWSVSTNYRLGNIWNGTSCSIYVNGTPTTNTNVGFTPQFGGASGNVSFGLCCSMSNDGSGNLQSPGNSLEMVVSEVVVSKNALSAGDVTNLDNYFKATWGL